MELLLVLTILFSSNSHAGDVERYAQRARGFESHLAKREAQEAKRAQQAHTIHEERQARVARYEKVRKTFLRRPWVRDGRAKKQFEEEKEMRRILKLEEQRTFAKRRRQELRSIERMAASLKPREYNLETGQQ